MTDGEDVRVKDGELPAERSLLDELYRWRWYGTLALLPLTLVFGGVWWHAGLPGLGFIGLSLLVGLAASGVSGIVALPLAFVRAEPPSQRALVVLDPREDCDFSVRFFDPEEWKLLDVDDGELHELTGTAVPAALALEYDAETHTATGTSRAVPDPQELERNYHRVDQIYGDLQDDVDKKNKLLAVGRTLVRRATDRQVDQQVRTFNEATMPAGDSVGDVWDEMTDAADGEESATVEDLARESSLLDERGDVDREELDQEDLGDLDDLLEDHQREPATDGGRDE